MLNLSLSETREALQQAKMAYFYSYLESIKHDVPKLLEFSNALQDELARRKDNERSAEIWLGKMDTPKGEKV